MYNTQRKTENKKLQKQGYNLALPDTYSEREPYKRRLRASIERIIREWKEIITKPNDSVSNSGYYDEASRYKYLLVSSREGNES